MGLIDEFREIDKLDQARVERARTLVEIHRDALAITQQQSDLIDRMGVAADERAPQAAAFLDKAATFQQTTSIYGPGGQVVTSVPAPATAAAAASTAPSSSPYPAGTGQATPGPQQPPPGFVWFRGTDGLWRMGDVRGPRLAPMGTTEVPVQNWGPWAPISPAGAPTGGGVPPPGSAGPGTAPPGGVVGGGGGGGVPSGIVIPGSSPLPPGFMWRLRPDGSWETIDIRGPRFGSLGTTDQPVQNWGPWSQPGAASSAGGQAGAPGAPGVAGGGEVVIPGASPLPPGQMWRRTSGGGWEVIFVGGPRVGALGTTEQPLQYQPWPGYATTPGPLPPSSPGAPSGGSGPIPVAAPEITKALADGFNAVVQEIRQANANSLALGRAQGGL